MSPRCLVRGSLNIDEFFHVQGIVRPGQTISSTGFERRGGGKGANQAAAVARAGEPVSIVGAVGDDGAWLLRDLKEMGVSVDGVCTVSVRMPRLALCGALSVCVTVIYALRTQEPTGRAIIQLTPAGENCIILHKGANYALQDTPAQIEQSLLGMSHLLLQNEIPWQTTVAYLTHAHDRGLVTVFNPSPMPSDDEIRSTYAPRIGDIGKAGPKRAAAVHEHRVTLGAAGVVALTVGALMPVYLLAAELQGDVRDTTGAGDCFTGYLVAGLMQVDPSEVLTTREATTLLRRSVQAAGMCVEKRGATESMPKRVDVEARLSEN
ncbi:Ribokinase-like protein [Artomyces pyxidatus]|uniref:Ribokinase-like protein n=1 Tax=Artomyces pyxidatus TaxID=48021 RepID=A0ACB8SPP6_9AGAM|nr:Ribokinase-like protein [Artomyces pyxidatus]